MVLGELGLRLARDYTRAFDTRPLMSIQAWWIGLFSVGGVCERRKKRTQ